MALAGEPRAELEERRASGRSRARGQEVADALGNTPAVCRSSYIDPRVIDAFLAGDTIAPAHERGRRTIEAAVLDLIDG